VPPELFVGERSQLLRHDQAPGVEDELAELLLLAPIFLTTEPSQLESLPLATSSREALLGHAGVDPATKQRDLVVWPRLIARHGAVSETFQDRL
jgi:hypothetical protein